MAGEPSRPAPDGRLQPFCAANLRAYLAVLAAWVVVSAAAAGLARAAMTGRPSFLGLLVLALAAVMGGMAIMFISSLANLRKLRPGFERLARGERDVDIPPVWCPVLTSATQAARRLAQEVAGAGKEDRK